MAFAANRKSTNESDAKNFIFITLSYSSSFPFNPKTNRRRDRKEDRPTTKRSIAGAGY
jgi:hypothetical protein